MGMTRKTLSVFTLGGVDFLSDRERTARSTRLTKQEAKKQTRLLREQNRLLAAANRAEEAEPADEEAKEVTWKWW